MTGPAEPAGEPAGPGGGEEEPEPRWQYEIDAEARAERSRARRERWRNIGGPVGFTLLALWKVGRIALVALGKVALLFKIPVLGSVLSGALSIGAYAVFLGWSFAIGLVGSLLVHELGHVVQIRREGLPIKALNFVPFLGAYVLSEAPRTPDQQARVSIAGPVAGTALALALWAVAGDSDLLKALAYTGFFLNLFNLLPVAFLDGAGVGSVFTAGWWLVVAAATGAVALVTFQAFAAVAALIALILAVSHRAEGWSLDPKGEVPFAERAKAAALYVGVVAVCAAGMNGTFRDRKDELVDRYGAAPGPVPAVTVPGRAS